MIQISGSSDRAIVDLRQGDYEELLGLEAQRCEQGPEEALPPVPERMGLIRGRTLLSTPMSKNTWTATPAVLAAVWARRATDPVTPAATPSPSVSAQFTTRETRTLRRVVPLLVVSAIPGTRSVRLGLLLTSSAPPCSLA
jgi:hypothetical protein